MSQRCKRMSRKSSTPFFPGAWPNSSAVEEKSFEADISRPEDVQNGSEAKVHPDAAGYMSSPEPAHLDHVVNFHRRMSKLHINKDASPRTSIFPKKSIASVRSSQFSPQMTNASTSPSQSIPTPSSTGFSLASPSLYQLAKKTMAEKSASKQAPKKPPRNPRRPISQYSPPEVVTNSSDSRRLSAMQLDAPLLSFSHGLPPLKLPSHQLSFSPETVASYFSGSNVDSPPPPPSPPSCSSTPSSFAIPEPNSERHLHSNFASTFFPVSESISPSLGIPGLSASTSFQTYDADSPVLPSEDDLSPSLSGFGSPVRYPLRAASGRNTSNDMDAFGLAANGAFCSDTRSHGSIPTSFRSVESISAADTARGHPTRQSSVSLSLSLSLSSVGSHRSDFRRGADQAYQTCGQSQTSNQENRARTISSEVTALNPNGQARNNKVKSSKFLSLGMVKQFSKGFKKLFGNKPEGAPSHHKEIGITTTTAVTNIEYTSEHPISRVEAARHAPTSPRSHTSRIFKFSPSKRRQTMPPNSLSVDDITRPARPVSFLAMDSSESSQPLLYMPSIGRSSRTMQASKERQTHGRLADDDLPLVNITAANSQSVRGRSRTQTAPATRVDNPKKTSRRFSVTAALGEAFKTTVIPHPPLPIINRAQLSSPPTTQMISHRRSASTSAADARNAASLQGNHPIQSDQTEPEGSFQNELYGTPIRNKPKTSRDGLEVKKTVEVPTASIFSDPIPESIRNDSYGSHRTEETQRPSEADIEYSRSRSQTQSTVHPPVSIHNKRRSRGFSLSSAISKRALRARSVMTGKAMDPPLPALPSQSKGHGRTTSVSGVSFDMLTTETAPQINFGSASNISLLRAPTTSGCADYDPDIVLDRMSFAGTPESGISDTDLSLSPGPSNAGYYSFVDSPKPVSLNARSESSMTSQGDVTATEASEEREFMRALGLEFDAIVDRARRQV
ncbi:hypothetical protein K474DRAFT_1706115 [Panus rudis PR-1116 ss-1]|nr:hypothetical protein K474DRAFT_1706115 [Panus rudis PR-1116 ss-1]